MTAAGEAARSTTPIDVDQVPPMVTLDVDWAPDFVIEAVAGILRRHRVRSTWFVTHRSPALAALAAEPDLFELGIHPNFLPGSTHGATPEEVLAHCLELVPDAVSMRAHGLVQSSAVLAAVAERTAIAVEATPFFPGAPGLRPHLHHVRRRDILRTPFFWEDDYEMVNGEGRWRLTDPLLEVSGLRIFNFHPVHVYLNSSSMDAYRDVKAAHANLAEAPQAAFDAAVNPSYGTGTFFRELVERLAREGGSWQLRQLHERWTGGSQPAPVAAAASEPSAALAPAPAPANPVPVTLESYRSASLDDRAEAVRQNYERLDGTQIYATSRDFHLRELEIDFLARNIAPGTIVDLGCGNGYTILSLAQRSPGDYLGLDFSERMIEGARTLTEQFGPRLKSRPRFEVADVRHIPLPESSADFVLSERCLLNLPSREDQYSTIRDVHRVLKPGGVYLMVEGTEDGLRRLNRLRESVGLEAIPSAGDDNASSLKFEESELREFLDPLFEVEATQYFGTYYLVSRVVHPLLVHPDRPRFDAPINAIGKRVAEALPDAGQIGHMVGYRLKARK